MQNTTLQEYKSLPGFKLNYPGGKKNGTVMPELKQNNPFTFDKDGQCENATMETIVKGWRNHTPQNAEWYVYGKALRRAIFRCVLNRIGNRARRENELDRGHERALQRAIRRSLKPVHEKLQQFNHQNAETQRFNTFTERINNLYYPGPLYEHTAAAKKIRNHYKQFVMTNNLPARIIAPRYKRGCHPQSIQYIKRADNKEKRISDCAWMTNP